MRFITSAYWDIGIRKVNEDSLVYEEFQCGHDRICFAAVADGVGGLRAGEIASGYAIESFTKCMHENVYYAVLKNRGIRKIKRIFLSQTHEIYEGLKKYADIHQIKMGTTLSLILIYRNRYLIIQLGDSAIYRMRHGRAKRLSQLHNNINGALTKCISSMTFHVPYFRYGYVLPNTGFLICSDGFFKKSPIDGCVFDPKELNDESVVERRLRMVGKKNRTLGENDNMAAIYVAVK